MIARDCRRTAARDGDYGLLTHRPWPGTDVGRPLVPQHHDLRSGDGRLPPSPRRARGTLLPRYVEHELRDFLECGILTGGFARARCGACGHDFLVAFSRKGRGICPSRTTRRMAATAAHLVEHVFPQVPVRQWVITFPKRLRYFLHREPALLGRVRRSALRAIESGLRRRCPPARPSSPSPRSNCSTGSPR